MVQNFKKATGKRIFVSTGTAFLPYLPSSTTQHNLKEAFYIYHSSTSIKRGFILRTSYGAEKRFQC
jgi:hypothetical protein